MLTMWLQMSKYTKAQSFMYLLYDFLLFIHPAACQKQLECKAPLQIFSQNLAQKCSPLCHYGASNKWLCCRGSQSLYQATNSGRPSWNPSPWARIWSVLLSTSLILWRERLPEEYQWVCCIRRNQKIKCFLIFNDTHTTKFFIHLHS